MAVATCRATAFERRRPLPVDTLIPDPLFTSTHAITIDAPPERVWPWIAQMGGGRAGWYSWDAIDNGGAPSATRVLPELQAVAPGDVMPAVPGASDAFIVAAVHPPRELLLTAADGKGGLAVAWEHLLEPIEGDRTRLIVRARASTRWIDLARAKPAADHQPLVIERVYGVLARLPRRLLLAFAGVGHRVMEARHLRGIQRRSVAAAAAGTDAERRRTMLLACGVMAAVLYIGMTFSVGLLWKGYSIADQMISELSAIDAPTRPLWLVLGTIYSVLMFAFGWGVWRSSGSSRAVGAVGALVMTQAVFGLLWPPMHQRAVLAAGGATLTDTLHIVWTAVSGVFFMCALAFGSAAFGRRFRLYSVATMVVVFGAGAWTGRYAAAVQANLPTPFAGVWERVNTTAFMVWVAVLAIALLRHRTTVVAAGPRNCRTS